MSAYLLHGGQVVDGTGTQPRTADVLVAGERIVEVGAELSAHGAERIDCAGKLVFPGLIDMHSHADDAVFDERVQLALLRQGVTTVVTGQDGVSYAPGDGTYGGDYFGGLLGAARAYRGGGTAALLASYDGAVAVNVAYLVPLGTVRHEVRGDEPGAATPVELDRMRELVREELRAGAVGVSSGLDYVPGLFADTAELTALAGEAGALDRVYVTHMRGGYEDRVPFGIDEVEAIARGGGVRVHVSHLHGDADVVLGQMARLNRDGLVGTFDAYPYRRGCTLLAMLALPPELVALGLGVAAERLADPAVVADLVEHWFPEVAKRPDLGPRWLDRVTYASVPADGLRELEGLTLAEAGDARGRDPLGLLCEVLSATRLHAVVVARNPRARSDDELARIFTSDFHTGGSDGIYLGGRPHPRGWGTFARYLARFTRMRGDLSWADAAVHLSARPADVLGLRDRGRVREGAMADLAVVDPVNVADAATYLHPTRHARGIGTVLVAGRPVLVDGEPTGVLSGRGLRA